MKRRALLVVLAAACNQTPSSPLDVVEPQAHSELGRAPTRPAERPIAAVIDTGGWTVEPTDTGEVIVRFDHSEVATMRYVFFGPGWQWGGPRAESRSSRGNVQPFAIGVPRLHTTVNGRAHASGATELTVDLEIAVAQALSGIEGIGVEWRLRLDNPAWEPKPTAVIATDGRGFALEASAGSTLRVSVAEPPAKVYFERNDPSRVRMLFAVGDVAAGTMRTKLRVEVPQGGRVLPALADRYGPQLLSRWHRDALVWDDWPVDVRALFAAEVPAGKHGRLAVRGDALVFEDGTVARFWGTNLAANALFSAQPGALENQADRIAALGYNLVRLHHHDAGWSRRNVFVAGRRDTQHLDESALRELDLWIDALARRGVYVWLDLHVSRRFGPDDGIAGFAELQRTQKGEAKGFNYVNPRIERLMDDYAAEVLRRKNHRTQLAWADDPAIVAVLVTNENDLTDHFGNLMLPNKGNPEHQKMFETLARSIARETSLPLPQSLQLWRPGPSKLLLAELQHRFDARAITRLRKLGVRVPIATTSFWGRERLYSLLPLSYGDLIDVHSYGDAEALGRNPHNAATWLDFIAAAALVGKPLTVSEWNVPPPERDRFTAPLWLASVASLQGWDALMLYAYNQGPTARPQATNQWSSWIDPSLTGLAPAAAIMFRRGDVSEASRTFVLRPPAHEIYGSDRSEHNSATIRTLTEQSRVVLALPDVPEFSWDLHPPLPSGATAIADLDRDLIEPDGHEVRSDTGELRRDWAAGVQTIDTARSQAAAGWLGGRRIELTDVAIEIRTAKATVAFTSLDAQPLASSERILVTAVGRAISEGAGFRSEPVAGRIAVRHRDRLILIPLTNRDRSIGAPPAGRSANRAHHVAGISHFDLPTGLATHWFLLVPETGRVSPRRPGP